MDRFENASIIKKANIYFEGKVTSRTVLLADGTKKTLGIIMPGEYEFGTADKEIMEVLGGKLNALLRGALNGRRLKRARALKCPLTAALRCRRRKYPTTAAPISRNKARTTVSKL